MDRFLASCFGLGRLPVAPGTWGSLPVALVFGLMSQSGTPGTIITVTMAILAVAGAVLCVKFAPAVIAATGSKDPREVVADELAGQAVTFLGAFWYATGATTSARAWSLAGIGFVSFRVFDVLKPWPIRKLEKFPQGWGVLADDLLAGVFAAVVLQICAWLWFAR